MTSPQDPLFADCPDRHGTGSEKWDRYAGRDVLPVWVADMDFSAPPEVLVTKITDEQVEELKARFGGA